MLLDHDNLDDYDEQDKYDYDHDEYSDDHNENDEYNEHDGNLPAGHEHAGDEQVVCVWCRQQN